MLKAIGWGSKRKGSAGDGWERARKRRGGGTFGTCALDTFAKLFAEGGLKRPTSFL